MINFLSSFSVSVLRFFSSVIRFFYIVMVGTVAVMLFFAVPLGGMLFLFLAFNVKGGFVYLFLGMAIAIPSLIYMIAMTILNHVGNIKARSSEHVIYYYYQVDDEPIYDSNQNIFSTQSLINAEIPYTQEHLERYGSLD